MWLSQLPPFVTFYLAAALMLVLPQRLRYALLLVPVWSGANLYFGTAMTAPPDNVDIQVFLFNLELFKVDKLSLLFGYLFHLAAFIALLYSLHVKDRIQQVASIAYAGSALGAIFCGDLISLFIFWEMLAVTSVWLIWARKTRAAYGAGMRYLIIQVLSGVLMFIGIILHYSQTQSFAVEEITLSGAASWLLFIAFGIKCAFPLLHSWLTDAYAAATAAGTIFLSAFTTKVAVYALARFFPGTELLIYIGVVMTCFPIFYAVIENDLRKVLAYSLINQLGFMVCGIGIGTALALNGAVAHAFTDVIFKGLLFMTMGAVLHRTGHTLGSDLGGLHKRMPITTICCVVGAASISAFPLFSGFISKSMVMAAMLEQGHDYLWLVLLFASAGVFHHAGIKIPYFAFFAHDRGLQVKEAPVNMLAAMVLAAVLCILIGSAPDIVYALLPWQHDYQPYDVTHVLTQLQLLFFSALAFVWLQKQGLYPPELRSVNLDTEWFYRKLLVDAARGARVRLSQARALVRPQFPHHLLQRLNTTSSSAYSAAALTRRMAGILIVVLLLGYLAKMA